MAGHRFGYVLLVMGTALPAGFAALGACGGDRSKQADTASKPLEDRPPPPQFEMSVPEVVEVEAGAPDAPDPSAEAPKRRPQPKYEDEREVKTTIGESGAVFRVGGAVLRIPEEALRRGVNLSLAVQPVGGGKADGRVGKIYVVGRGVKSHSTPFELSLPLATDAGTVKLVIQRKWKPKGQKNFERKIVEPRSIDAAGAAALFELPFLYKGEYWLTTQAQ
jgi:hypothetical protein